MTTETVTCEYATIRGFYNPDKNVTNYYICCDDSYRCPYSKKPNEDCNTCEEKKRKENRKYGRD